MAITIDKRAPLHHLFTYNPVWWVVQSTNTAQANFRFIMDIYITGQTFAGANYIRLKVPTDPIQNKGVFNPNSILERYLSYDLSIASGATEQIKQASHSVIQYQLKFGEEYGPSSAVVAVPDLATTGFHYAYNGVADHTDYIDFINTSGSPYLNASTTTKKFLTNFPRAQYVQVRSNENAWLQILNNEAANNSSRAKYEFFDSTFQVLLATVVVNNTYRLLANNADRRIIVPVGYNIDDILPADIISGTLPQVSNASNVYWKVKMTDTSGNQVSEEFIFQKNTVCSQHTEFRLHFMNEHGAFDSFTFIRASDFDADIKERKKYAKPLGKFIASNNYMYEAADRQDIPYYTEMKDTIALNSDWMNEATMFWLEELVTSPVVYVENGAWGRSQTVVELQPVTITDKKFERKLRVKDRLFNLQIKIQPTYARHRQRG